MGTDKKEILFLPGSVGFSARHRWDQWAPFAVAEKFFAARADWDGCSTDRHG
jgi:hypothetical protein